MLSGRADNSDWYLNFNLESKRNGVRLLVKKKKKKVEATQIIWRRKMFSYFCNMDSIFVFMLRHDYGQCDLSDVDAVKWLTFNRTPLLIR